MKPDPSNPRGEAIWATFKVWVQCAGCGRSFRGLGILCARCKFKPVTRTNDEYLGRPKHG